MFDPSSILGARERAARGDLAVHDHVCGIYETRDGQYEPACRFIKIGLERKEQCLYIAQQLTPLEFTSLLEARGVNAREAIGNGSLQVRTGQEVRRMLGGFTPASMFSFLALSEKTARSSGFVAFRWAADMMWLRQDNIEPNDFFVFEAALNQFLPEHELSGFCQYSIGDFKSELLIAAAETHPLLVYDELVCDNFYFIPPEEYLKPQFSDIKFKRLLGNIITRERLMQKFLADAQVHAPAPRSRE